MKRVIIILGVLAVTLAGVICWNISGMSKGNNTNTVSDAAGQPGEAALTGDAEGGRTLPTAALSEPGGRTPPTPAGALRPAPPPAGPPMKPAAPSAAWQAATAT